MVYTILLNKIKELLALTQPKGYRLHYRYLKVVSAVKLLQSERILSPFFCLFIFLNGRENPSRQRKLLLMMDCRHIFNNLIFALPYISQLTNFLCSLAYKFSLYSYQLKIWPFRAHHLREFFLVSDNSFLSVQHSMLWW